VFATDTICAVATPAGRGGVGVVRCSGPLALRIAESVSGPLPATRQAARREFVDESGTVLDDGLLITFAAPASFTGEDVVEFHGHGAPIVMQLLIERLLALGARLARPGEFSERAFLNGKLDLIQAEAVADLIAAASRSAARAAVASLKGEFSRRIDALAAEFVALRVVVEASIDFADEDIEPLADEAIGRRLQRLQSDLHRLLAQAREGKRLTDGFRVVIAGAPNAGKSTLLNALAGEDVAIVTPIPGTTRDVVRQEVLIDDLPILLVDTAGLRESDDPVEAEGIRRALGAVTDADHLLVLIDDSLDPAVGDAQFASLAANLSERLRVDGGSGLASRPEARLTRVMTKVDASGRLPGRAGACVAVSAQTGAGMDALRAHLRVLASTTPMEGLFSARARHLEALRCALQAVEQALLNRIDGGGELVAEELRQGHQALSMITGAFGTEELLGEIFASFCIGK
jgi:tRNA modification GTPase